MSRALRILNGVLRRVVRPRLAVSKSPQQARRNFARFSRLYLKRPPYLAHLVEYGAPPLHHVCVGQPDSHRVLLYFHGGAYICGSPDTHLGLLGRLSEKTGMRVIAPAYRLAPNHTAPAPFEDACAAHSALLEKGIAPCDIVLGGDSAGGGLALALLAHLCARNRRPAAVFAFSPWVDLTLSSESLTRNAACEPFLPVSRLVETRDNALGKTATDDPRASPLFATFDAPPPVQIHVGTTELLLDDSRRMAEHLRAAGGQVELNEWPDAPHLWPLFDGYIPEARLTVASVARFLEQV